MPTFGSGTMTPLGGLVSSDLAQPLPYTLLSLARYAKIMGINPSHFWGAAALNVDPQVMPLSSSCTAIWYKYEWQDVDRVARYTIANEISNAERDIAEAIGYWPAPTWIADERIPYERYHRREYFTYGFDIRGRFKPVTARWGRIINVGRRAVSLVGTATSAGGTLVYTDEDSDGLYETATIVVATTLTDVNEIKVYFYNMDGDPDWEIREPRSKVISGGFVTIVFDAWLLIDPDLYEFLPTSDGNTLIDIGVTTNFVNAVDVYREYVDTSQAATELYWEPDYSTCDESEEPCEPDEQDGCLRIRDEKTGILVPIPAEYDSTGGTWSMADEWTGRHEPDYVKVWYYAGEVDNKYKRSLSLNPLSDFWAQTIAWLATARLPRPLCTCGNLESLTEWLRTDLSLNSRDNSFFMPESLMANPFGPRGGEVATWRRISKLVKKRQSFAMA